MRLNKEQRDEFIPQFMKNYKYIISTTRTEPDHGSDQFIMYNDPNAPNNVSIQTYAEKRGNEYIINGTKHFASNSGAASLFIVCARINRNDNIMKSETISWYLVKLPVLLSGNGWISLVEDCCLMLT